MHWLTWIVEPGFFASQPVRIAAAVGGGAAVVSALVGVFTVVRGQSFAGHALTDVSTAGGSGAVLLGVHPLLGFVGFGVFGAGVMDAIGIRKVRGRDLATGIVLGASIGLAALILYLDTTVHATTGAAQQILFGSIFATTSSTIPLVVGFGSGALAILAVIYRPLLLHTVSGDIAAARGVPVRMVGLSFMVALAVAVGLSSLAIGAILSTALLVGPAATALRLTTRFGHALVLASVLGAASTWLGVLFAYDSYYWVSGHRGLPVSFFVVAIVFVGYLLSGIPARRRNGGRGGRPAPRPGDSPTVPWPRGGTDAPVVGVTKVTEREDVSKVAVG
ncbi:MAG TPA: metal ABC transporter permease [Acidimicrobiales bacterium]|nr:metal ABC transporter permease [Acidimicrobiales bacterium]